MSKISESKISPNHDELELKTAYTPLMDNIDKIYTLMVEYQNSKGQHKEDIKRNIKIVKDNIFGVLKLKLDLSIGFNWKGYKDLNILNILYSKEFALLQDQDGDNFLDLTFSSISDKLLEIVIKQDNFKEIIKKIDDPLSVKIEIESVTNLLIDYISENFKQITNVISQVWPRNSLENAIKSLEVFANISKEAFLDELVKTKLLANHLSNDANIDLPEDAIKLTASLLINPNLSERFTMLKNVNLALSKSEKALNDLKFELKNNPPPQEVLEMNGLSFEQLMDSLDEKFELPIALHQELKQILGSHSDLIGTDVAL